MGTPITVCSRLRIRDMGWWSFTFLLATIDFALDEQAVQTDFVHLALTKKGASAGCEVSRYEFHDQ